MARSPVPPASEPSGDAREDPERDGRPAAATTPRDAAVAQLVHDLRNPLNTILMNVELVALMVEDGATPTELGDGLNALERAVTELAHGLERLETHVANGN